MSEQQDNSLDIIQPIGEKIKVIIDTNEVELNIYEFSFGDISRVITLIANIGVDFTNVENNAAFALGAFSKNAEKVYEVMQIALNDELERNNLKDAESQIGWLKSLRGIDGVRLASKIVKVNVDFFYQSKSIIEADIPQLKNLTNTISQESQSAIDQ